MAIAPVKEGFATFRECTPGHRSRQLFNYGRDNFESNQVEWTQTEEGKYSFELPRWRVTIAPKGPLEDKPDVEFEIDTPEGRVIGVVRVKPEDPEYQNMFRLIESADAYVTDNWNRAIDEVTESIERSPGRIGEPILTPPPPPPPVPTRPTEAQAERFFHKIAGKWHLDYSNGTEDVSIDENGNYTVDIVPIGRIRPRFRLVLNQCDPSFEHVEISKQELNGRTRQIEVLTVSDNSMSGYAKHDQHSLTYTRR